MAESERATDGDDEVSDLNLVAVGQSSGGWHLGERAGSATDRVPLG